MAQVTRGALRNPSCPTLGMRNVPAASPTISSKTSSYATGTKAGFSNLKHGLRPREKCAQTSISARLEGPPGGGSRLIIPGGGAPAGRPGPPGAPGQRPGQHPPKGGGFVGSNFGQRQNFGQPQEGVAFYQPFRKPAEKQEIAIDHSKTVDEQMQILREKRGRWHELAAYISNLKAIGMQPDILFETTGISAREQTDMVIAADVRRSLVSNPNVSERCKDYFEFGNQAVLLELRIVAGKYRMQALEHVAEHEFDANQALELARAIKDFCKREKAARMEGFEDTCGDMLALKRYRDAMEVKGDDRKQLVEGGLELCTSASARESLERLVEAEAAAAEAGSAEGATAFATLSVIELNEEELGFWPVPVAGAFDNLSPQAVEGCPVSAVGGIFRTFKPRGWAEWAALPLYPALAVADDPIAIIIADTTAITAVPNLSFKKSQALLIVDRHHRKPKSDAFYLVSSESSMMTLDGSKMSKVDVVSGRELLERHDKKILGRAVLAVRPPVMEEMDSSMEIKQEDL